MSDTYEFLLSVGRVKIRACLPARSTPPPIGRLRPPLFLLLRLHLERRDVPQNDMKVFAEATLGNTVDNSKRAGFIKYDRNVLRFQAVWDDRESLYGDIQRFEVGAFFLRWMCALVSLLARDANR